MNTVLQERPEYRELVAEVSQLAQISPEQALLAVQVTMGYLSTHLASPVVGEIYASLGLHASQSEATQPGDHEQSSG